MGKLKGSLATLIMVLAAALLAAPGSGAGATTAQAGATPIADPPWVGFKIPKTNLASSGWIGARKTPGGAKVYRVDPKRKKVTTRYSERKWAARFKASSGKRMSRRNTACAALLLGKYGTRAVNLQAAGVDVAVYHLLYGGGFRHGGAAQVRRTDQRDNGPLIRAYAQNLIENYCALRGPYRVTLTSNVARAEVGDTITYTLRVVSRERVPMEGIPIAVWGRTLKQSQYETDADGKVTFTWTPVLSGPLRIAALTKNLPFSKVRYFVPRRQGASRVVQAGLKQRWGYKRIKVIPIMGQPTLRLDPDRPVTRGERFRTRFRLAHSYSVPREAKVQVYGPFGSEENTACVPRRLARESRIDVSKTDWYRSRLFKIRNTGWYVWRVRVPGDPNYNKPVALCAWPFEVK